LPGRYAEASDQLVDHAIAVEREIDRLSHANIPELRRDGAVTIGDHDRRDRQPVDSLDLEARLLGLRHLRRLDGADVELTVEERVDQRRAVGDDLHRHLVERVCVRVPVVLALLQYVRRAVHGAIGVERVRAGSDRVDRGACVVDRLGIADDT